MLALADIGAQMMVMGPKHAAWLGVKEAEYLPTKITIKVADNWTTRVLGMAVTEGTDQLYLCSFYTKLFKLDRKIESKYTSSTSTPACVPSLKVLHTEKANKDNSPQSICPTLLLSQE